MESVCNFILQTQQKTYFNGTPARSLYIRLPKEMGLGPTMVGRLLKCCYGTREAGATWERFYAESLVSMGFQHGEGQPLLFLAPAMGGESGCSRRRSDCARYSKVAVENIPAT